MAPTTETSPRRVRLAAPTSSTALAVLLAGLAVVAVATVIRPLGPSLHDPDAAATVLYFDRMAAGQRVEVFVPTTPKPLLTLLYGVAWSVTGDWRVLGLLTLAAFGVAVWAAASLAHRVAGVAGAVFVAVALVTTPAVIGEVARANSVIWGLAAWAIAGLGVVGGSRHALIVGLALAAAASFRNESFILVALATAGLVIVGVRDKSSGRRWSPVLLGWAAMPLALAHDLIRTGDPLAWVHVPAGYTAITTPGLRPTRPLTFAADVFERFAGEPLLVALAVVGILYLLRRRAWALAAGLVGLTLGITSLVGFVAWRGVYVTPRYFEQVDLGLIGAAAIGVGAIAGVVRGITPAGVGGARHRLRGPLAPAAAAILAIVVTLPTGPFDPGLTARLDAARITSENVDVVKLALRDLVARADSAVPVPITGPAGLSVTDPASATILVPRPLWTRLALELDVPLTRLGDSWLAFRDTGALASLHPGQAIYHDRAADLPVELYAPLEAMPPPAAPGVLIAPLLIDESRGIWVLVVGVKP